MPATWFEAALPRYAIAANWRLIEMAAAEV
jgi:hypothetical protein